MAQVKTVSRKQAVIPEPEPQGSRFSGGATPEPPPATVPAVAPAITVPVIRSLPDSNPSASVAVVSNFTSSAADPGMSREDYKRVIQQTWDTAWTETLEKFLNIGRALSQAKRWLQHGDYEAMIAADMPFSKQVAHQLKTLSEAVEEGRFTVSELPRSYSAAYILTTLSERELQLAKENGLVSPTASRTQISDFRSRSRTAPIASAAAASNHELEKLRQRRAKLLAEAARIAEQIAALEGRGNTIEGTSVTLIDVPPVEAGGDD